MPLFINKLDLKQEFLKHGILTPEFSDSTSCMLENVIVKQERSSFGLSLKGPFRKAKEYVLDVEKGEFFEQFVSGGIVKIWFWNGDFVCFKQREMPRILGDGKHTIGEIIDKHIEALSENDKQRVNRAKVAQVLKYYGKSIDDVIAKNDKQIVDFIYGSIFAVRTKEISLADDEIDQMKLEQFNKIGEFFWGIVKKEINGNLLFTADAILDDEGRFWVLEANGNPSVLPSVYDPMIHTLAESVKVKRAKEIVARAMKT